MSIRRLQHASVVFRPLTNEKYMQSMYVGWRALSEGLICCWLDRAAAQKDEGQSMRRGGRGRCRLASGGVGSRGGTSELLLGSSAVVCWAWRLVGRPGGGRVDRGWCTAATQRWSFCPAWRSC